MYTLIVCGKHKNLIKKPVEMLAQGICEIHDKYSLHHKNLKMSCPKCAYLRGVCQICGSLLSRDDLDNWHAEQGTLVPKGKSRVYL